MRGMLWLNMRTDGLQVLKVCQGCVGKVGWGRQGLRNYPCNRCFNVQEGHLMEAESRTVLKGVVEQFPEDREMI